VYDSQADRVVQKMPVQGDVAAATGSGIRNVAYLLLRDGTLLDACQQNAQSVAISPVATGFGSAERGFFALPRSGRVVGVALDGFLTVFDPESKSLSRVKAEVPPPAGPAADPHEDAWYFAGRQLTRYRLDRDTGTRSGM